MFPTSVFIDVADVMEKDKLMPSQSIRKVSGIRRTYHGITYQLKWLMLVALQSRKYIGENFTFQTEDEDAGKFDDVVWTLKDGSNDRCSFLQAKHVRGRQRKISTDELIKRNNKLAGKNIGYFALNMYFISYRDVLKNNFFNKIIDHLIIATNIDMNDQLKKNFKMVKNNESKQILRIFNEECKNPSADTGIPGIWRVDLNSPFKKIIQKNLEDTYDLIQLAKLLADCVHNNQEFELKNDLRQYEHALFTSIVDQRNGFSENFIRGENLSAELINLRSAFYREAFKKKRNCSESGEIINPEEFAKKLASLIGKSKEKTVVIYRAGIIKKNIDKLSSYVIIEENGSLGFNPDFLINDDKLLHTSFELFKKAFRKKLEQLSIKMEDLLTYKLDIKGKNPETGKKFECNKKHLLTEKSFWEHVKCYRKFVISSDRGGNSTTSENTKHLPADSLVSIKRDIKEFLEKLIFALNYEDDFLGNYIQTELGKELEYLPDDNYVKIFQQELSEELKKELKDAQTSEKMNDSIDKIKQTVYRLSLSSETESIRNEIKKLKIEFKTESINRLGVSAFLNDSSKQILKICTSQTELSTIKLHQYLNNTPKYETKDSFLFIRSVNLNDVQHRVIEVFKSKYINLLIIESQYIEMDSLQTFWTSLQNVIECESTKKVIMIGQNEEVLSFKQCSDRVQLENDGKNSLTDLTTESQDHILKISSITFQGKSVKLSSLPDSRHIFDAEFLSQLIKKKKESVGFKKPCLSDNESIYYFPCIRMNEKQLQNGINNNPEDIFVFKGTPKNEINRIVFSGRKANQRNSNWSPADFEFIDENSRNSREDFKQICSSYLSKNKECNQVIAVHLIEEENNSWVWKQSFNSSIYIPRKLSCKVIDKYALNKFVNNTSSINNDIFIIADYNEDPKMKISKIESIIADNKNITTKEVEANVNGRKYILIKGKNDEKNFDEASHGFNVHWLQEKNGKLFWRRTRGQLIHLDDVLEYSNEHTINEKEFREIVNSEKIVIIAGQPGVGKTTSLIHMIQSFAESEWIIKLSLVSFQNHLENYDCTDDIDSIVKLLLHKTTKFSRFEENMLKNRIEGQGHISIIFDGFDEITSKNQEKIIHILSRLKDTKSKLIITTRLNVKDKLENSLSAFSYYFQPFSEDDQKQFLQTFWNASMKFTVKEKVNQDCLSKQVNNFHKNMLNDYRYELIRIPFLTKMIAEIYQSEIELKCTSQHICTEEKLTKLCIYEKIVKKRYENYFNEKLAEPNNSAYVREKIVQSFNSDHQHLAFHKLFSNRSQAKNLLNVLKLTVPQDLEELKLVGLIQSSSSVETFHFIHQTFAEYFVADFFSNLLQHEASDTKYELIQEFLLTEIFRDHNKDVYDFLENMLEHKGDNDFKSKWTTLKGCTLLQEIGSKKVLIISDSTNAKPSNEIDISGFISIREKVNIFVSAIACITESSDDIHEDVRHLFQHFPSVKDLTILEETLEFFDKITVKSTFKELNEYMESHMLKVVMHYFSECKKQNHEIKEKTINLCAKFLHACINGQPISADVIADKLLSIFREQSKRYTDFEQFLIALYKYKEKNLKWLEERGIHMCFTILNQEISKIYNSQLNYSHIRNSSSGANYAKNILNNFLMPTLDLLQNNNCQSFDRLAIISMLNCFIDFSVEKNMHVRISPQQLHMAINLIENVLGELSPNIPLALKMCSEFLIALKKAGIMIILVNDKFLLLEPESEFRYHLLCQHKQLIDLMVLRLQNTKDLNYSEEVWNRAFPPRKKQTIKRRIYENDLNDIKRIKIGGCFSCIARHQ